MDDITYKKLSIDSINTNKIVRYLTNDNMMGSGLILLSYLGSPELYINMIENHIENNSTVYILDTHIVNEYMKYINIKNIKIQTINTKEDSFEYFKQKIKNMPKFDFIIQNPPYSGSTHLDFFEAGLDMLSDKGQMIIIEPATWLINIRKNGKSSLYNKIKEKIKGHVKRIVIENYNKEFNTKQQTPFSITYIDKSIIYDSINFSAFGDSKLIKSIYDCNLIGKYDTIWSILDKIKKYGDFMKNHITEKDLGEKYWYVKCSNMASGISSCLCAAHLNGGEYDNHSVWSQHKFGDFFTIYSLFYFHYYNNSISNKPLCRYDAGKHITDKIAMNIYGSKEELENWKYFIFNNTLPLFISVSILYDRNNNNIHDFIPWLVDKKYTDEEIYKMFNFTDEEIHLIESTIKKFEYNSPWFRRYMCGPNSATDEEVQKYLEENA